MEIIGWAFFIISVWLSLYGVNVLVITVIFLVRQLRKEAPIPSEPPSQFEWPEVTVQLPIYNEPHLVRRIIDTVCHFDYPRDKLVVQVLDDSDDDTTAIADHQVKYWKSRGRRITLIHRSERSEFKAGALKNGMQYSKSEFFAIFDADFLPPPNWLKSALAPYFQPSAEKIGVVQTRWTYINENQSILTRAQALLLDGDYGIDKKLRSDADLFCCFSGTAAVLRRRCIEEAGGWRGNSLSEDLDLSYRAQLTGWKLRYLRNVEAPAEIPTEMHAYKIQQARWAKGSVQTLRRVIPGVLSSSEGWGKKLLAILQLTGYSVHPLMVLMVLLSLPISYYHNSALKDLPMAWLGIGSLGAPFFLLAAEYTLYPKKGWWKRILWFPFFLLLGTGIAVSNTVAYLTAWMNIQSPFVRTPKTGIDIFGRIPRKFTSEVKRINLVLFAEVCMAAYASLVVVIYVKQGNWMGAGFLAVYAAGFTWAAAGSFLDAFLHWVDRLFAPKPRDATAD